MTASQKWRIDPTTRYQVELISQDSAGYLTVAATLPFASFDNAMQVGRNAIGKNVGATVQPDFCWEPDHYEKPVQAFAIQVRDIEGDAVYGYYYLNARNELYFEEN